VRGGARDEGSFLMVNGIADGNWSLLGRCGAGKCASGGVTKFENLMVVSLGVFFQESCKSWQSERR